MKMRLKEKKNKINAYYFLVPDCHNDCIDEVRDGDDVVVDHDVYETFQRIHDDDDDGREAVAVEMVHLVHLHRNGVDMVKPKSYSLTKSLSQSNATFSFQFFFTLNFL